MTARRGSPRESVLRRLRRRAGAEDAFTMVEVLVAVMVLTVGIISLISAFDSSRRLGTRDEERQTASALAQQELQRIQALPWSQIALNATPTTNANAGTNDPTYYIYGGLCPGTGPTSSPCYQWDWSNTSSREPLVIDTASGDPTANPQPWTTTITAGGASVRLSGKTYHYVTWVNDTQCTLSTCGASADAKRIVVAVTVDGRATPITLSTIATNSVGGTKNGLTQTGVTCQDGTTQGAACVH